MPPHTEDASLPVFDGHNDTLLNLHLADRGKGRSFFTRSDTGHLDLPRAREGGFAGGLFAIFVPTPGPGGPWVPEMIQQSETAYEVRLAAPVDADYAAAFSGRLIQEALRLGAESHGAVEVVCTLEALHSCLARRVLAMVLHFEGAEAIDARLQRLEGFYRRGLRSIGITWSRANAFGWGVPFKFPSTPDIGPGLTAAGKDLVRACNDFGLLVDLAHLNARGFWDAARISRAPLVVSHTAAHSLAPRSRNLTDDQLAAVADSHGVVGVTFAISDLTPDGRREGDAPLSALVRHIVYLVERMGIDHVAFGSDLDGTTIPSDIGDVTGFPRLLAALAAQGFDPEALRRLAHGNWLRVIGATWKNP
jgi:membrane dipeptidase